MSQERAPGRWDPRIVFGFGNSAGKADDKLEDSIRRAVFFRACPFAALPLLLSAVGLRTTGSVVAGVPRVVSARLWRSARYPRGMEYDRVEMCWEPRMGAALQWSK
jgi:hypothetical protein